MQTDKELEETRNKSYAGLAFSLILTPFKLLAGILGNSSSPHANAVFLLRIYQ